MLRGIEKVITYLVMIVVVVFAFIFLVRQIGLTNDLKDSLVQAKQAGFAIGDLNKITELHQSSARVFFLSFFSFFLLLIGVIIIMTGIERAYDISEVKEKVRYHLKSTTPGVVMVVLASFLLVFSIYKSSNLEAAYSHKLVDFNNYKIAMEGYKYPDNSVVRVDSSVMPRLKSTSRKRSQEVEKEPKPAAANKAATSQTKMALKSEPKPKATESASERRLASKPETSKRTAPPSSVKPKAPSVAKTSAGVTASDSNKISFFPPFAFLHREIARNKREDNRFDNIAKAEKGLGKRKKTEIAKASTAKSEKTTATIAKKIETKPTAQKPLVPSKPKLKDGKTESIAGTKAVVHANRDRSAVEQGKAAPSKKIAGKTDNVSSSAKTVAMAKQEATKSKPAIPKASERKVASSSKVSKATAHTGDKKESIAKTSDSKAKAPTTVSKPHHQPDEPVIDSRPITPGDIEWARSFQKRVTIYGYTPNKSDKQRYHNVYSQTDGRAVSKELHWAYSFLEKTRKGYQPKPGELSQYESIVERNVSGNAGNVTQSRYH